ncbi:MAG: hypothetical protein ACTHK7_06185, partial [Aureliella sp.]
RPGLLTTAPPGRKPEHEHEHEHEHEEVGQTATAGSESHHGVMYHIPLQPFSAARHPAHGWNYLRVSTGLRRLG